MVGVQVGSRYVAREVVGHGSFGTVFRGEGPDGPVAVKLLRPDLANNPDIVNRFLRERSVLLKLRHPHLVGVRDLVAESGVLALVMDLVDGPDLRRYLAGRQVPPLAVAGFGVGIASGLAHAHAEGVVHRDLKPENVLVRDSGQGPMPLVADFGVARLVTAAAAEAQPTGPHLVLGTPAYLAPELARGEQATAASDVYSCGILLYEMAAGQPPFEAEHPLAVVHQHVTDTPVQPAGMPDALWRIIAACLAKDPSQRPAAATLAVALRAVARGTPQASEQLAGSPEPAAHATQVLSTGRYRPVARAHTAVLPNLGSAAVRAHAQREADDMPPPARSGRSWLLQLAAYATVAILCLAAGYWVGVFSTEKTAAGGNPGAKPSESVSLSPTPSPTQRVVHVSDLPFVQVENGQGPVELNRATGGGDPDDGPPLTLDGNVYAKGLGAHAPSRVRFYPGGGCAAFSARVGLDARAVEAQNGSVSFQVVADDRVVYDSGIVRFSDPSRPVQVDVSGAQRIDLLVTDGGDGRDWDHADWADATLVCSP